MYHVAVATWKAAAFPFMIFSLKSHYLLLLE